VNTIKFLAAFGLWVFVAKAAWEGLRGGVSGASAEGEV
jgi:hypothetical protein